MAYTNIDDPSAHFQIALYTGNANYNTITNDGNSNLGPDLIWGKCRSTSKLNFLYDTTRGVEKRLESDNTGAEDTGTNGILNFYTDGFRLGSGNTENDNGETYVAWQWKANGGSTSSNTAGTITSTVQANTDAGFSIVTWTGNSSTATIGHGLGVRPEVIILKARGTTSDWPAYHKDATNGQQPYNVITYLNLTDATGIASNSWGTVDTDITSSVFYLKYWINYNTTNVAYCFAEKQGYSKFGKYVGNSNTDGAFVYTGFKPAFIMLKQSTANGNGWFIIDSKRDPFNSATSKYLRPDETGAEGTTSKILDLLSNGFKLRNSDSALNGGYHTYIYMAFAENPFVTSTGVPACAR